MSLRNPPGKKLVWKFTAKTGKVIIQGKKGGITWYRYQKKVRVLEVSCIFSHSSSAGSHPKAIEVCAGM